MKQVAAISAVASLFIVGVLVGVFGTHLFYAQALGRRAEHAQDHFKRPDHGRDRGSWSTPGIGGRRGSGERFERFMAEKLGLSPEQVAEIDRLLDERDRQSQALRREMEPRVRAFVEETAAEIAKVLTSEQRRQWKQLHHSQRDLAERFLLRGHEHNRSAPHPGPMPDDGDS